MLPGFTGSLVTEYFADEFLEETFGEEIDERGAEKARLALSRELRRPRAVLGPVCGPRQVYDLVTSLLADTLGYRPSVLSSADAGRSLLADAGGGRPLFFTTAWGESLESCQRDAARAAVACSASWCLCFNGREVRLLDARRYYARRFVQFDLDAAIDHPRTFRLLWALLRSSSFAAPGGRESLPFIDRVAAASDRNTVGVCRSLRDGVLEALAGLVAAFFRSGRRLQPCPSRSQLAGIQEQSLTVVYRVLFLLFAESRRLLPTWHPVYRDAYSLDGLLRRMEHHRGCAGLWETLQAISRLSHAGCRAGELRVTPFNGRLFSPKATPLAERHAVDNDTARNMVLALATTPTRSGRARIVYRDLGVEQLGAVYESVLDYAPVLRDGGGRARDGAGIELRPGSGARKATASFYTPRALTTYLVRRTLAPLVAGAAPERILGLRVLDPAMGSGAFLVAACRFLAGEYAAALVREGRCLASDIDEQDRRSFRRAVAQRCLYGVDINPMAVQLARLSLWLSTLAPDRPLTFFDHRLLAGNSLLGASPDDALRHPGGGTGTRRRAQREGASLFDDGAMGPALRAVLPARAAMAERPDDTIRDIRGKERLAADLTSARSPLAPWKTLLDAWCARWFSPHGGDVTAGVFAALADFVGTGRSPLAAPLASRCLHDLASAAEGMRPFHWPLEFPEVFYDAEGAPLQQPGFDAVIGNPPWDMIRADNPGAAASAHQAMAGLQRFARGSGIYKARGEGHQNLFQLFVERAFHLVRTGGRVGLVVPWGLFSDQGCDPLRRLLFDRASLDPVVGFDNADRIFNIHRSVRFAAFCATSGGTTEGLRARLGERDTAFLDQLPSTGVGTLSPTGGGRAFSPSAAPPVPAAAPGGDAPPFPLFLARGLLERLSGPGLPVPNVRTPEDIALLEKLSRSGPALSDPHGWGAGFGRELNASDDRKHFVAPPLGLPVLEGKHIEPFRSAPAAAAHAIPPDAAARLLDAGRTFRRARLAYRDVSSATNRLTLIAAIVPGGCVTVHTLFCLRTPLARRDMHFLCGILNSLVANYFVRFWVSSHVTTSIVGRLPVPRPAIASRAFRQIAALSTALSRSAAPLAHAAYPRLQALVSRLYGLTEAELHQVLASFPLIEEDVKARTMRAYEEVKIGD